MKPSTLTISLVFAIAAAACGPKSPSQSNSARPSSARATGPAGALDLVLARWQQNDQTGAIQLFLDTAWETSSILKTDSALAHRESDLPALDAGARDTLMKEVTTQLAALKRLAAAVRDQGVAVAPTNSAEALRCFAKLDECAAALDRPGGLKIVQLTAQAIRRMAATEAARR